MKRFSRFSRLSKWTVAMVALGALGLGVLGHAQVIEITGAGATFPAPLYSKWASDYHKATGVRVNYQSVGSGAGVKQINAKTVIFGASDKPLSDAELQERGQIQFPTVVGGVVPVYNIRGLKPGELKLTGSVLADIFLKKIKKWNDPKIVTLNPGLKLPSAAITVVRRSDGSGTTFGFTNYLSQVSPEWKEKVGEGKAVNWPTGVGGKGNEGVAAFISRLPNSLGYLEYAYVKQNKMRYALLQNRSGKWVEPSEASFKAAGSGADWKRSFYQILGNQPGDDAWPITSATFIIMYKRNDKPQEAAQALKFFDWVYKNGDEAALNLDYVPMSAPVKRIILAAWRQVGDAGGKALTY